MSDRTGDAFLSKRVSSDQRKSAVKSLILEYEQLGVNCTSENIGILRMGAEQSTTGKLHGNSRPATINSKSFVKQRVSQFDYMVGSESQNDKRKRHKSTTDNQVNLSKDFQRSKSFDFVRREKDRYSRTRQISPKINEDASKFDASNQKTSDSNNNSLQKRNSRKKINKETTTESEKKKDNNTNLKLSQLEISEVAPASQEKSKKNCADNGVIRKDILSTENKNETISKSTIKRNIRTVKSIKKVFENKEQKPTPVVYRKTLTKRTIPDLDRPIAINNDSESNQNKSSSNKHIDTDKELSETLENDNKSFKSLVLETCTENNHCDKNEEPPHTVKEQVENFRKDILNGIAEQFYKNDSDVDLGHSFSEDEFNQIENDFQEMERTIEEMKEHHGHIDDEKRTKAAPKDDQYHNETENHVSEDQSVEEPENINVYVKKHTAIDELEDEFGQRSFGSFENINFTEAYNRRGDELIMTSVAAVEHRSLTESFTSKESLFWEDSSDKPTKLSENPADSELTHSENENDTILHVNDCEESTSEETTVDGGSENAAENKLYFTAEEIQQESESEIPSNRSTLYSSTTTNSTESMERYSKAESDEGVVFEKENEHIYEEIRLENNVEIRSNSSGGFERTIKTETIYDSNQNPRIAKVTNVNSEECVTKAETPVVEDVEPPETLKSPSGLKPKKDYIIEELIETEKKYINQLEKVVWDYMPVITDEKLPPSLIGKSRYLFGNIRKIYGTTQKFYKALKSCGNDHEEIAKTFLNFRHLFELYPLYFKNKPVAHQYLLGDFKDVVTAREKQLNDRLGLASNLLTPIQRLGKYILFLEQIQKELKKKEGFGSDYINKAIEIVCKQMSRGNDYIAIDSIKDCPISLLEQGSFVLGEKFNVIKPRKYEAMIFLFEEIIVFTTVDPRNPEMYIYRDSIKLNEMGIVTFDDQPLVFHLKRFPSYKKGPKEHNEFVIEAKKNKDKKTWTELIEKRLWEQLVKCKEKQRELHSNQGKRNSVVELPDRARKKKPGYSSLPSEMRKTPPKSIFYYKVDRDA